MIKNPIDAITLEYFLNRNKFEKKLSDMAMDVSPVHLKERKFYRRRIIQLVKDMFKEKPPSAAIGASFDSLVDQCIRHFKVTDTSDGLQSEYPDITEEPSIPSMPSDVGNPDELLFNSPTQTNTLDSFVVTNHTDDVQPVPLPTVKEVKLFSPEFKTKGVKSGKKHKKKQ